MKSQNQINVEAARKLPAKLRKKAQDAWGIAENAMLARVEQVPKSKRPKVFEVHHGLTAARAAFIAALVEGKDLGECTRNAIMAFPSFEY